MRVALIAPPFIPVPPKHYGGTEFFVAQLTQGLLALGIEVVVYANGESTISTEVRSIFPKGEWPLKRDMFGHPKDVLHTAWAVENATHDCDVIHLNSAIGLVHSRFVNKPFVYTVHHGLENDFIGFYQHYSNVSYVCISNFQCQLQNIQKSRTIYHGADVANYQWKSPHKREYLCFLGRIAPVKGTHLAIEVAQRTGIPLKIAGEVQPMFKSYFDSEVKPHIDGKLVEYVGEADMRTKNELLVGSLALLFPIQWDEPFGLVMIEAMACGTPVIALNRGSVSEVVKDGVSGVICSSVDQMVDAVNRLPLSPAIVRHYVEQQFSTSRMAACYAELYREVANRPKLESAVA